MQSKDSVQHCAIISFPGINTFTQLPRPPELTEELTRRILGHLIFSINPPDLYLFDTHCIFIVRFFPGVFYVSLIPKKIWLRDTYHPC